VKVDLVRLHDHGSVCHQLRQVIIIQGVAQRQEIQGFVQIRVEYLEDASAHRRNDAFVWWFQHKRSLVLDVLNLHHSQVASLQ